ncbi:MULTISPECIES: PD-(D/E)XK nuclease family protein [unclassified Synechococcus]|uniref:PD-(D/E)XK nuclease family protein n=1 Tax=unclassified Synechococcus TaxID=2626047 RepID=UPI001C2309B4|nr:MULTISPECIES: PD-(D/E)XK nuclease family protein [unclassified Synechococcus]
MACADPIASATTALEAATFAATPAATNGAAAGWLEPLAITRDDSTWTYRLTDSAHWFPISITGVIGRVCKNEDALAWIEAWREVWEPRGNTCHAALQHFALHRWQAPRHLWPAGLEAGLPVDPWGQRYGAYGDWIAPLLAEPLWGHVQVVASELMLYDLERNVAGTLDLLLRFPDGSYGIADLKSLSERGKKYDTRAQLGAGLTMAEQHYGLPMGRALTIWVAPGRCEIRTHTAEECRRRWVRVFNSYVRDWRPF